MAAIIVGPLSASAGLPGGVSAAIDITAAQVIKAAPGICVRVTIQAAGTAGDLTFNDSESTEGADATNEFFNFAYSALSPGVPIEVDWPCANGITVSSVPTGAQVSVAFT